MTYFFNWFQKHSRTVLVTLIGFCLFIVFESFQQLFYLHNFNNGVAVDVGFWDVFQTGMYRWIIWLAISFPLGMAIYRFTSSGSEKMVWLRQIGLVMIALLLNLVILSVSHTSVRNGAWANFPEIFEYYFFHKAPIILVSLVFLVLLVHYFRSQTVLEVTFKRVGELQKTNQDLIDQVSKEELSQESLVFEVKVGNRVKLLSENKILWIQADDYCVRIYTIEGDAHIMRTSLKALESKLPQEKFLRIHRKAIVNMSCIHEYYLGTNPKVILNDNTEVAIAQSRMKLFKNRLQLT